MYSFAGQVEVDQEVYGQLLQTGHFQQMQLDVDEVFAIASRLPQHVYASLATPAMSLPSLPHHLT